MAFFQSAVGTLQTLVVARISFFLFGEFVLSNTKQMLMCGKVSQENYVELTAASAIPNKEIKSPQILRY